MFRKIMMLVLVALLPFGAVACTRKPTPVPTSSVSYETAIKAITELSDKMKDGEERLTELEVSSESALDLLTEMQKALQEIEAFRNANPGHFGRVTDTTFVDRIRFECAGEVSGFGQRDLFKLGGKTLFCTQPGIARPADGSVCFNIPGTKFWDCGAGQILRECVYCGCGTATPEVVTATPEVVTATPEVVTATPEVVTATPEVVTATPEVVTATPEVVTATPIPTLKPDPTVGPPGGTATCVPTPSTKPCEDQNVNFWAKPGLDSDNYGTKLKIPGNGHHVPLPNTEDWQKVQEEVRMCQVHVVNAHKVHDWITGKSLTGCVLAYRQGIPGNDEYRQVRYEAVDGYGYHIHTPGAGFGLQEGGSQMTLALLSARKPDGSYACRIPGDQNRPGAQDIQLMELGLEGR